MIVTFRHDGTGFRGSQRDFDVDLTMYDHTASCQGTDWIIWDFDKVMGSGSYVAYSFAEAMWQAAQIAAGHLGGVVLHAIAGVPVPDPEVLDELQEKFRPFET